MTARADPTDPATYPPLDTLKRVCDDVWIVDGPVIRFGMPWPKLPFPTRMTVLRLGSRLFIHSPTPLAPASRPRWRTGRPARLDRRPQPDPLLVDRRLARAFPEAAVYLAPRTEQQAAGGSASLTNASTAAARLSAGTSAIETCPWPAAS